MFVVLLVTILCVVVEIAHLYLARTELENALEAAALAGADYWAKNPGDTGDARTRAQQYAAANTVDGQPVVLSSNYGTDDVNDNAAPDGNLIFGAVSFEPVRIADNAYAFDHATEPSCTVTQTVVAEVDLPWKVQGDDTYGTRGMFEFEYDSFTPINPPTLPTPQITKITYGLAGIGGIGLGRFDVNTSSPPANESNIGSDTLSGWGPFSDTSPPPGNTPVTFTPTNPDGLRYKTLEVVPTTPLLPGNKIRFGVDTDMMDGTAGPTVVNTSDDGGDFYFFTSDFYMAVEFNGDSANPVILYGNGLGVKQPPGGNQTFLNRGQAQKFSYTITIPGNGTYGVRAQANIQVTPWLNSFLGCPIGPFRVAARTTARAGCGMTPNLVRIATDGYTTFPAPSPP